MRMAQRKFSSVHKRKEGDEDILHIKKTKVEPKYFALVKNAKTTFVKNKFGQVVVFSNRDDANQACREKGWPGNIGMGDEKFDMFRSHYAHIMDPPLATIPKMNKIRFYIYPVMAAVGLSVMGFIVFKYTNIFEFIADVFGETYGLS